MDIEFRGKKSNGDWVYGDLLKPKTMFCFSSKDRSAKYSLIVEVSFINGGWATIGRKHWVLKETIGQFTGFLDKNKKKIYRGDNIDVVFEDFYTNKIEIAKGEVVFKFGGWHIEFTHPIDKDVRYVELYNLLRKNNDKIVNGNIYDK